VGGLHHAEGPRGRLDAPVLKAAHLQVEPAAEPAVAADEAVVGAEPVLEAELIGVHAAIADRVDRPALEPAGPASGAAWLVEAEAVRVAHGLLDQEERQPTVPGRAILVGAREQHEHRRPGGERAPGLGAAYDPATL